jgi:hypothetical protein
MVGPRFVNLLPANNRMRLLGACLLTAAAALGTTASVPAGAHSLRTGEPGSHGVDGMSERELRSFETEVLGSEHAAEHARQRSTVEKDPTPSTQTLMAAEVAAPPDPATSGEWAAPFAIPVMGINAVMLPTGKVMWWSYPRNPSQDVGDPNAPNTAQAWLWNPVTGAQTRVDPPLWHDPADPPGVLKPANIWCSGQSLLSDGRVLVTGGNLAYDGDGDDYKGLNKVYTFNPWNETWTEQPDMRHGRWYPSQVLLPDGRTAILSGFDESGGGYSSTNKEIEIFTPSPNLDGRGTLSLLGTRGTTGAPPDGGLYPHTFVMPSGRVMVAGPDPNDSWFLRDPGPSNTFAWDNFTGLDNQRLWGTGVLLPGGSNGSTKVQLIGGSNLATSPFGVATSSTIDEATGGGVTTGPSMNIGRSHHNTVLLPDSSMVTVGGGVGKRAPEGQWAANPEQRQVEIFDPTTGLWRLGAAQAEARTYHSTAILLPDGRVISAGDDYNGGIDRDTAEIYSPPYLFKGPRPTATSAPSSVEMGKPFSVSTPDTDIARAVLVAPGATTHSVDMNQRVVGLTMTERAGAVDLTAPPNGQVAPPGYYMLFLVDDAGVPSVAKWIKLLPSTATPPPPPPGGLVASYSFDQGSGATAPDSSGNDNTGTLTGGIAWTPSGRNGSALNFDGTNDRVDVPDAPELDLSNGMTLEAWVKPDTLGGYRTLMLKETSSYLAYALYGGTTSSNRPAVEANKGELIGGTAPPLGSWTHLAGTYDGSTLRIYVNGTLASSKTTTQTMPNSTNPLYIGGNVRWGEFFDGAIDDVRIYNRALSQTEIQADRDTPVGGGTPPPPPDATPPTVSITAPANNATVSGSSVSVTANASDTGGSGLVGVQFKRGATNIGAEDTTAPYATSFDSTQLPNGNQQLTAVARDAAGNTTTSTTVTVNIQNGPPPDATPPTVSITAPANNATVSGSSVSVTANASDTGGSGLVGVQFKRGATNIGAEDTTAPYATSFDSTQLPNGNQQLTAVARDAAGNTTTSTTVTVNIQNGPQPPPNGLVAAYSFNESLGMTTPDSSGRGNIGFISGATWGTGRYGGGLVFDGVNDRITVPDSSSLDLTTGMTIETWIRPTALGGYRTAVIKETPTYLAYALYASTTSSNRPAVEANRGELIGGTAPALNTWTHVTGTYDGTNLRLYINGVLASTKATTQLMPNSASALYIGGNAGWGEWFSGTIDEVRIYNRALSQTEIQADRDTGIPLATP